MSRWSYDTTLAPPQSYEAVDKAVSLLKAGGLMVSGTFFLASTDHVYGHEEPVSKPARWVFVAEHQELGGHRVEPSGLLTVRLHVKVVGPRGMTNYPQWHAAMHARISRTLTGKPDVHSAEATLNRSEIGWPFRQWTEPTRPEYYANTDTRESFALFLVTLEPTE